MKKIFLAFVIIFSLVSISEASILNHGEQVYHADLGRFEGYNANPMAAIFKNESGEITTFVNSDPIGLLSEYEIGMITKNGKVKEYYIQDYVILSKSWSKVKVVYNGKIIKHKKIKMYSASDGDHVDWYYVLKFEIPKSVSKNWKYFDPGYECFYPCESYLRNILSMLKSVKNDFNYKVYVDNDCYLVTIDKFLLQTMHLVSTFPNWLHEKKQISELFKSFDFNVKSYYE